ncbi:MAG: hypothetical protein AAGC56_04540, partial [Pseudomonadota bacterium]
MSVTYKPFRKPGLSAAFVGLAALGACGAPDAESEGAEVEEAAPAPDAAETPEPAADDAGPADADDEPAPAPAAGDAGEGEGGESGEGEGEGEGGGGEGGVDLGKAGVDPVVYRSALAITRAHALAARDAYAAGETEAAAEMFGHPVGEVLADMQSVFDAQGVAPFYELLLTASATAADGGDADAVAAQTDAILAALTDASAKAPASDAAPAAIAAGVVADQIERAAQQYVAAAGVDAYEPYLDGYGFAAAARTLYDRDAAAIRTENAGLAD